MIARLYQIVRVNALNGSTFYGLGESQNGGNVQYGSIFKFGLVEQQHESVPVTIQAGTRQEPVTVLPLCSTGIARKVISNGRL